MTFPEWAQGIHSALDDKMGIEFIEVSAHRTAARMPVQGNTQPFGYWHGGASCVLAETLASMAAFDAVGVGGTIFGVDINATHHRAARDGWVNGVATALYIGGRLGTWQVELTNDAGELMCTARVTCALQRPSKK